MADKPAGQIDHRDFPGIDLSSDSLDMQPGQAVDQVNAKSDQQGMLRVRLGALPVTFDA